MMQGADEVEVPYELPYQATLAGATRDRARLGDRRSRRGAGGPADVPAAPVRRANGSHRLQYLIAVAS
jgi:hypothetical protein